MPASAFFDDARYNVHWAFGSIAQKPNEKVAADRNTAPRDVDPVCFPDWMHSSRTSQCWCRQTGPEVALEASLCGDAEFTQTDQPFGRLDYDMIFAVEILHCAPDYHRKSWL